MDNLPKRKHPRLKCFDYSSSGAYFITICTQNRRCLLSRIEQNVEGIETAAASHRPTIKIKLTAYGIIAEKQLHLLENRYPFAHIGEYVIMPNHIHFILILDSETATVGQGFTPAEISRPTVSDVICAYKSLTTKECKKTAPIDRLFQTSFHEHIIRNQHDYDEIADYIAENPSKWMFDKLFSDV